MDIPILQATPVEEISRLVTKARTSFFEHKTCPVEFRLHQLRKLYWAVKDNEARIGEALSRDLGKPFYESVTGEIGWLLNDIIFVNSNLKKWLKDETPKDVDLAWKFVNIKVRKDPLGCVLVMGAYNYPFQLTLGPVIGAIAAGNTVVIKPSDNSPNCAVVIQEIIASALDPSCYTVIQGGAEEGQALLAERWDKIFFTGSSNVGRLVAKAAAVHLTPVVLELGGINPSIVTKNANPKLVARRMLWAKIMAAGQVCTSQTYMLVEKSILPAVVSEFQTAYKCFYPQGAKGSPDYSRIVNLQTFRRLKAMIDNSNGKIVLGGSMDEKELFIEPTVVQVDSPDDSMLAQESFGPILAILPVENVDEAIQIAHKVQDTTLTVHTFGSKEENEKVLANTRSGLATINDATLHIQTVRFGGIGESGHGAYRGKASFDVFVHQRPIFNTPSWAEALVSTRYPPYAGKLGRFKAIFSLTPDFDRQGRRNRLGWLQYVLTLGGGTAKAVAGRAAVLAVIFYFLLKYFRDHSTL